MSTNAAQHTQEVEITLLVCSDNAPRAAQRIAELNVIGPYRLVSRGARSISDTYLDTSDHRLYRHQLSLRVRRVDGETFITFKGPAEQLPWGGASRLEIEVPWSEAALRDILPRLEIRGLEPARMIPIAAADPLETLADLGLQPIQARENQRQVRDLIPQAGPLRSEEHTSELQSR